jgi:hypothetical protein
MKFGTDIDEMLEMNKSYFYLETKAEDKVLGN